jgi:hypothetical protein
MFDSKTRKRIATKVDRVWEELRNARKRQRVEEMKAERS